MFKILFLQRIKFIKCMKSLFIILLVSVFVVGCYYDSEEDLYGTSNCITTNPSFANDIQPIINLSCAAPCHFPASSLGGGISLDSYNSVLIQAKNGSLVGSIKHEGFSAMPKDQPKLDDCKIAKIDAWVKAGSLNN
jgi:hypothetical protein